MDIKIVSTSSLSPPSKTTAVWSPSGSCPVTMTPVRTVIPRLVNDRMITLATSWSQPGRILGKASSSVTRTPRSDSIEANSQPMAPPPITAAERGSSRRSSNSSEV